jgi:hypothetical protein
MNRDTIQKLLGGYATGTLTPEEQQALFAAALDDQELFDALAREQSLRDLLRDPAAKAQVLMALDTARPRWYQKRPWMPAAAAVAMAGIGLMAVVVVRRQAHAPAPVMVAEVKQAEVNQAEVKPAAPAPAPPLSDAEDPGLRRTERSRDPIRSRGSVSLREPVKQRAVAPPRAKPAGITGGIVGGVPGVELPPPPAVSLPVEVRADQPALVAAARKDEAAQSLGTPAPYVRNQQQLAMVKGADSSDSNAPGSRSGGLNARLLFYANSPGVSAGSGGRLEIASEQDSKKKAAPAQMRAASGMVAAKSVASPAAHLGVRCSILRKRPNGEFAEAALDTVLDGGEAVTLKLVPNGYGYLVIWEMSVNHEWRTLAKGPAEPYKAFETPLLNSDAGTGLVRGSGPRQLYVQFTRNGPLGLGAALFQNLVTQGPAKLTQTAAEVPDQATYIVNSASDPSSPSLMFFIWLNHK